MTTSRASLCAWGMGLQQHALQTSPLSRYQGHRACASLVMRLTPVMRPYRGLPLRQAGIVVHTRVLASLVVLGLCLAVLARAQNAPAATSTKERVTCKSDHLTLVGFLFTPTKPGPFPGLLWNHGSEQHPGSTRSSTRSPPSSCPP